MAEAMGINKIIQLRQKRIGYQIAADMILAVAITLSMASILCYVFNFSAWWSAALLGISSVALLLIHQPWKVTTADIASFLNQTYAGLEESTELLIKPAGSLNLLQQLQLTRVENALHQLPSLPPAFTRSLKRSVAVLLVALIISTIISKSTNFIKAHPLVSLTSSKKTQPPAEKILPQIELVAISVNPPAYTGKRGRTQDKFTLTVEEGATVKWHINTNIAIKQASLLFNEHEKIDLTGTENNTAWSAQKAISKPGFYQVNIDGKLSDLYQVEVIKDSPPVIRIKSPKQYTYIDAGEAQKVMLTTTLTDDYGISNAMIYATVAKGSGEGVKFKEYKISFDEAFKQHSAQYNLQKLFDLPKLNMEPGDELYFYIQAQDTHQQQTRTDVYIVSIQDTAALLSMDGILTGVNLKPEYFRSERQIILDTEKLLKDKDTISTTAFNQRCNEIGVDQKLLRLRYGKFLGEEDESGSDLSPEQKELSNVENFSNADKILDAYTDKHDKAEDATFFEPGIKAQLKATLSEMWNAELHLRLYKPLEALPFEYKALRLLKDLQQKSRSYVAKTAYNPPPLKMEKRLSGDLSKIVQPVNHADVKQQADEFESLKKAVEVLEQLKNTGPVSLSDKHLLQVAGQQLSLRASAQPGVYLAAVSAMRRILADDMKASVADIATVEKAIQKTLPLKKPVPQSTEASSADMGLSRRYYDNLKTNNR